MDTPPSKPPGRNEPCPCKSGRKYKQCCLAKDEATAREAREAAMASAQSAAAADVPATDEAKSKAAHRGRVPHEKVVARGGKNPRGFQKSTGTPRKVGGG